MNFHAIVQARMGATRLPGKVLMEVCEKPLLEHLIDRLKLSKNLDNVIVATTNNYIDDPIANLCKQLNVDYFRGSENDVLKRVLECAKFYKTDVIIEITGDCPMIDWTVVDEVIELYKNSNYDYISNILKRTYPRGLDVQVFSTKILEKVNSLTNHPIDREHVSIYIYNHPEVFSLYGIELDNKEAHPEYRWTLDTIEDYNFIKAVFERLYPSNPEFTYKDVYQLLEKEKDLCNINSQIQQRNIEYYE